MKKFILLLLVLSFSAQAAIGVLTQRTRMYRENERFAEIFRTTFTIAFLPVGIGSMIFGGPTGFAVTWALLLDEEGSFNLDELAYTIEEKTSLDAYISREIAAVIESKVTNETAVITLNREDLSEVIDMFDLTDSEIESILAL